MPVYHRTQRLQIFGEKPEIQKLYGSRYRMVVRCVAKNDTKAWYDDNKSQIFADFGSLYSAQMSVDGIDARTGEAYDDMVLVKNEATYTRSGEYVIIFTYETLTSSFVQETEDKVDFDLNGLKRLTRTIIAKDTVAYSSVVGTSTTGTSPLLTLAQVSEDQLEASEDGFKRIQEVWLESGTLSETIDNVGSQKAKVIETIGADPATPTGYSLASKQESDFEGFQTNRFTFLKDNVVLSVSEDKVGSQKAVVNEVFNPTSEAITGIDTSGTALVGYSEANRTESDYEGIKTIRVQFLKDNVVLSRSIQTKSGGKLILEVVEVFNGTPVAETTGAVKIGDEVSDVDGIPTRRFTFAKGAGTIRTSTRPGRIDGTTEVTVISYGTEVTPTGTIISSSQEEEDGYIQYVNTAIQGTITGTKQTYKDVVQVEVPGTVSCTAVSVSSGGVSGTIAVPQVTPRKRKTIAATVTVEVLTTPTNTASIAYDLGSISCSVTSTNTSLTVGPGSTVTVGTTSVVSDTGYVQNFGASARIQTYPGCYLTTSSSTGLVSYITSSQPVANGNVISRVETDSTRQTKCIGTGSTSATGYSTTGVIRRNSRLIVTALDGTTYYEVITWSV